MNWWLDRQKQDHFVKKRQKEKKRSRACFKLEEILKKFSLDKLKGPICDLGAAPGSWAQVLLQHYPKSSIVGCDLLPVEPLPRFRFIQGDFCEEQTQKMLVELSLNEPFAMVTSDIAPSIDGNRIKEQAFFLTLTENIINFTKSYAKKKCWVVQKVFHGEEFEAILALYRKSAIKVDTFKPASSRSESREVFIVAKF